MVYLIIAILTSTSIMILFKVFKRYEISVMQAITVNYLVASAFGFSVSSSQVTIKSITAAPWFDMALIVGITFIGGFFLFALSAQKAGVAITAVASKMSVVIPVILGFTIFGEYISVLKILGILFTLSAFYLIFKKEKGFKIDYRFIILPLMLFIANGSNDSLLKYIQHHFIDSNNDFILFLSTIFFIALLLGSLILGYNMTFKNKKLKFKNIFAGIFLGLLNWYSTLYFLKALSILDVSVVVPVLNVSIVSLSAITGYFVFKEKLRPINWLGIFLALLAILFIAFAK